MIWFTADTHFGHLGILEHCSERKTAFKDDMAMDEKLIAGINSVVGVNDELYHLGDFCWQASRAGHYRQRIKVRKLHIVRGNHDQSSLRNHVSSMEHMLFLKRLLNSDIKIKYSPEPEEGRYHDINITKERIIKIHLSHYPLVSWGSLHHGGYHLYGHCHGTFELELDEKFPSRRSMDIGVDNIHRLYGAWHPISLPEVIGEIDAKK